MLTWGSPERFAQLLQLCYGGQLIVDRCVCGVQHREYFEFLTVGGFTEFSALMTTVITCMNEPLVRIFYDPPSIPDIYNLIRNS